MPQKFGSNDTQLATTGGAVTADNGSTLISGDSQTESALLFGPASLREIQSAVANGDFAIMPNDPYGNITADNALPYWSVATTGSTCSAAIVADAGASTGNVLRVTVGAGTNGTITLSRYIPLPSSRARRASVVPIITAGNSNAVGQVDAQWNANIAQYDSSLTLVTGTDVTGATSTFDYWASAGSFTPVALPLDTTGGWTKTQVAPTSAFLKISMVFANSGTTAAARTIDIADVRVVFALTELYVNDSTSSATTNGPAVIAALGTTVSIAPALATNDLYASSPFAGGALVVRKDAVRVPGAIYFNNQFSGPYITNAGTNARTIAAASNNSTDGIDIVSSTSSTRSGILVTKSVTGQPTTTLNGTGATDAFADVLRNGGIALDVTNARAYFYSSGWKYAALTTPSDSRLKTEITDINDALDKLKQLMPVAFKWKRPEAHQRTDAVADDGQRLGFIADQVATTDLKHWVEDMHVDELESDLVEDGRVLAVNIPQNEMEALVVQALLDIDERLKALESR